MKKYISLSFALVLLFSLSSCQSRESLKSELKQEILQEMEEEKKDESSVIPNDSSKGGSRASDNNKGEDVLKNNGENYTAEAYTKINIKNHNLLEVNLIYSNEATNEVRLEAIDEILDVAKVSVTNGTLTIDTDDPSLNNFFRLGVRTETLNVYIGSSTLEEISTSGALIFKNSDRLSAEKLKIKVAGFLEIDSELYVDYLDIVVAGAAELSGELSSKIVNIDVSGAADIDFFGATEELNIDSKGAADIDTLRLSANFVTLKGAGAMDASVYASDELSVDIAGVSEIKYKGEPVITNSTPLLSEVKKID